MLLLLRQLISRQFPVLLLARPEGLLFRQAAQEGIPCAAVGIGALRSESRKAQLVHVHDAHAHTMAALHAQPPFVVSRRVAFPVKRGWLSRWKYGRAARYLAVSKFVQNELVSAGISADRIDVVYDAVAGTRAAVWNPAGPVVAIDSNDEGKCAGHVAEAAGLADVPVLFSNDLERDLNLASCFVYLSRSEGFGSAALLAMAKGIPVIANRAGGLAEVFEDGVSGLYVDPAPAAVAEAIRRVRQDVLLSGMLRRNAMERAHRMFSVEAMTAATLAAYRKALA